MANAGPASCIFAKLATIHVVQKSMAKNLLHGNSQVANLSNLWGNLSLLDLTAYLPQHDMAKMERIQKDKQARTNKRVMNLSETKLTLPKTQT